MPQDSQPGRAPQPNVESSFRRRGRRTALALYYGLVVWVIVWGTTQLTQQLFFRSARSSPFPTCEAGLQALALAVERGRASAAGDDGEDGAVRRFREAVATEWAWRDEIASSCRGTPKGEGALDAIERLRYAEEHAARLEAGELAPLRRRVRSLFATELQQGALRDDARSPALGAPKP